MISRALLLKILEIIQNIWKIVRDPLYITIIIFCLNNLLPQSLKEYLAQHSTYTIVLYLIILFCLIGISPLIKIVLPKFKESSLYKDISKKFKLKINTHYPKVIHIFIFSSLITCICYKIFGITTDISAAEYIALLAVLVALGHLSELAKTNIDVKSSVDQIEELRKDLSLSAYVERAYSYYGGAQKHILSCTRYWSIDQEWIIKNYSNLLCDIRRDPPRADTIPLALIKYLEGSTIATNILSKNMNAGIVKFIGPVDIRSIDGLTVLPGALWRILFITAVKAMFAIKNIHNNIVLECYSYTMPFNFILVDNKVLMETRKYIYTQYGDLKEYGVDLGENKELANFLSSDFGRFAETLASQAVNDIIELGSRNMGHATPPEFYGQKVRELIDRIYSNNKEIHFANIASFEDAQVAINRLKIQFKANKNEEVRNIIGGLLWDYIYYVGKDKFKIKQDNQ